MRRLVCGLAVICFAILAPSWVQADDERIAKQIVQRLQEHKERGSLKGFAIDLQVDKGTVLLSGRVSDPQHQLLAIEVARHVDGVQQVVNDIEVTKSTRQNAGKPSMFLTGLRSKVSGVFRREEKGSLSEQQLTQLVKARIEQEKRQGGLADASIEVQMDGRTAWVSGQVESAEQQKRVLQLAGSVAGVDQVVNDLEVRAAETRIEPIAAQPVATTVGSNFAVQSTLKQSAPATAAGAAPAARSDQSISDEIMQKLESSKQAGHLRGFGISVDVVDGEVWLNGHVTSAEQQALVLDVARRVSGVRQVVNGVIIKSAIPQAEAIAMAPQPETQLVHATTGPSDEEIAQQVLQSLKHLQDSGHIRGFDIDIKVVNGDLWMRGQVSSAEQQQLVLEVARRTPGVQQVVNDLSLPAGNATLAVPTAMTESAHSQAAAYGTAPAPAGLQAMPQATAPAAAPAMVPMMAMGPRPIARSAGYEAGAPGAVNAAGVAPGPLPAHMPSSAMVGMSTARYDHPYMPNYAWPSYAAYPNYAALTYPKQYSPTAWPYIGPFYPYPQVPLGWRKVTLEWDDGWWMLDFKSKR